MTMTYELDLQPTFHVAECIRVTGRSIKPTTLHFEA